jgi:hypothetical protein
MDLDNKNPISILSCHDQFIQPDTIVFLAENPIRPTRGLDGAAMDSIEGL